jgi:hypothetical protein
MQCMNMPTMRGMSFQEKEVLSTFNEQDWEAREVQEVYNCLHAVKRACVREPSGLRDTPLVPERVWEQRYPLWFASFQAEKLFSNKDVWESVFHHFNEPVPGKISKWISEGYSVWLDVKKFDRQPGVNKLSPEELTFALNQAQEWVSMCALEEVTAPSPQVLVSNVVIAYRSGIMDQVC